MPGEPILRNPGVTLLWTTRKSSVFQDREGRTLIQVGDPEAIEWYCQGRPATRLEVEDSIDSGLEPLMELCQSEEERDQLMGMLDLFKGMYPQ